MYVFTKNMRTRPPCVRIEREDKKKMIEEVIRKKVYHAATEGDVAAFKELVQEDPAYLVDAVSFACSRNLLHIATTRGQAGIVEEVLEINPELARNLDSQNSSPLHVAAKLGYVEIASKLVTVAPEMCWVRDSQGMNPIHVAAINGHAEILERLIEMDPFPAREKVDRGQTALHLCVKHRRLGALQALVNNLGELVPIEDDDGDTALFLAVRYKQVEMVRYLVENSEMNAYSMVNSKGIRALSISRADRTHDAASSEITKILNQVEKSTASIILTTPNDTVMVVMALIATMAYQSAALSPPGGVWQDDSETHTAGESVMASDHPQLYRDFIRVNTIAFTSSVITICLLAIVAPQARTSSLMAAIVFGMLVSVATFYVSYNISVSVLTPNAETWVPSIVYWPALVSFLLIWGFLTLWGYAQKKVALVVDPVICGLIITAILIAVAIYEAPESLPCTCTQDFPT